MAIHAAKHKLANCRILENALLMRWQDGYLPRFPRFHCTPAKKPTKWHPCKDGSRVEGYKNQPRDSRPDFTVSCLCLDAGDLAIYSTYISSYPSRGRASPRQPQSKCMGFGCIRALRSRAVSGVGRREQRHYYCYGRLRCVCKGAAAQVFVCWLLGYHYC